MKGHFMLSATVYKWSNSSATDRVIMFLDPNYIRNWFRNVSFLFLFIYLFIYLCIYFIYLFIYLFIYYLLFIYLFIYFTYLLIYFIYLFEICMRCHITQILPFWYILTCTVSIDLWTKWDHKWLVCINSKMEHTFIVWGKHSDIDFNILLLDLECRTILNDTKEILGDDSKFA